MSSYGVGGVSPKREPIHIDQKVDHPHPVDEEYIYEIPPISPLSGSTPKISSRVVRISSQQQADNIVEVCEELSAQSETLNATLSNAEASLNNLAWASKGAAAYSSVISPPLGVVTNVRERIYYPLDLLTFGMNIDSFINYFSTSVLTADLFFQGLRGVGQGTSLLYKQLCIRNAEQIQRLLETGLKSNLPVLEREQLEKNIQVLEVRIEQEKRILKEEALVFGASTLGSVTRSVKTTWSLCGTVTPKIAAGLGWVSGVALAGALYYDMSTAEQASNLHSNWFQKWSHEHTKLKQLIQKRYARDPKIPSLERMKVESVKAQLHKVTKIKQESIKHFLKFRFETKEADFFVSTLLLFGLAAIQTIALVGAVGFLVLFPYLGLVVGGMALMAVGAHYWYTNRPNMFKELFKTYFQSTYYNIRHAIDDWLLQSKKIKLIEHQAEVIGIVAKHRFTGKVSPEAESLAKKYSLKRQALEKQFLALDEKVKYWKNKQLEIKERLLNAELADLKMRTDPRKDHLNVNAIVESIASTLPNMTDDDKQELQKSLNLNLNGIEADSHAQIRERIFDSFLGMGEDELVEFLKAKKA